MRQLSVRLTPESLIALETYVAYCNLTDLTCDRNKLFREAVDFFLSREDVQENIEAFKKKLPETYAKIRQKYEEK